VSILATLQQQLGDLDRIARIVKVFGMVNVAPGFNQTPAVIDGCSDLLLEVFGESGRHTRSAVGLAELPFDIAVEIELIARLRAEWHVQCGSHSRRSRTIGTRNLGPSVRRLGVSPMCWLLGASTPARTDPHHGAGDHCCSVPCAGRVLLFVGGG
jgi:YjgF/chorismate_mutase-like, putative endoribonuclease